MRELFYELILVALGKRDDLSHSPSEEEWLQLYELSRKQALIGVTFVGLQRLKGKRPPKKVLHSWIYLNREIEKKNNIVSRHCITVYKKLLQEGLRSCLLKGQGNAMLYGKYDPALALARQSGDIDMWVEGGFNRINQYVQRIAPTDEITDQHIQLHVFRDTEVELHFTPSRSPNRLHKKFQQKWFAAQCDRQMSHVEPFSSSEIALPTADFNVVYQLMHIYRHLFSMGIGLRQLMDYYILLETCPLSEEERDSVRNTVHNMGLDRLAEALMWILGKVFLLDEKRMIWKPDAACGKFLLNEVMQMGNFGQEDVRFKASDNASHLVRFLTYTKSKFRYIRFFPSVIFWQPFDLFIIFTKEHLSFRAILQRLHNPSKNRRKLV